LSILRCSTSKQTIRLLEKVRGCCNSRHLFQQTPALCMRQWGLEIGAELTCAPGQPEYCSHIGATATEARSFGPELSEPTTKPGLSTALCARTHSHLQIGIAGRAGTLGLPGELPRSDRYPAPRLPRGQRATGVFPARRGLDQHRPQSLQPAHYAGRPVNRRFAPLAEIGSGVWPRAAPHEPPRLHQQHTDHIQEKPEETCSQHLKHRSTARQ
jgi:hypothetical protein